MRLITWNARKGKFANKAPLLEPLNADIAVIPEIAAPNEQSDQLLWFGDHPNRGVAVVAAGSYKLQRMPELPNVPKFVVPVRVIGPMTFVLFAIWTLEKQQMRYIRAVATAIKMYEGFFSDSPVVMLGDFNSNSIWDKDHPKLLSHSAVVAQLQCLGLVSAYHHHHGIEHGCELEHTFYLYGHQDKHYHIDYCFLPISWAHSIDAVDIGTFAEWQPHSDHRPLVISIRDA